MKTLRHLSSIKYIGMSGEYEVEIIQYHDAKYQKYSLIKSSFPSFDMCLAFVNDLKCDNIDINVDHKDLGCPGPKK